MTDIKPEDEDVLSDVHQRFKDIGDASVEWFLVISMTAAAEHRQLGRTMTDAEMERTRVWIAVEQNLRDIVSPRILHPTFGPALVIC